MPMMRRQVLALLLAAGFAHTVSAQSSKPASQLDPVFVKTSGPRANYADPKTRRLEVLAEIWGNLALFHPAPSARGLRWDDVLIKAVRELDAVQTDRQFASLLNDVVFAPLDDPLQYATTIADQQAPVTYPAALTRRWLSAGTAYVSAVNRVYAGPYQAPDFAQRIRAVIDTLSQERPLQRLVVDLRSSSGVYYREGAVASWLGLWLRASSPLGLPLSVFRETAVGDLSEVKWLVSPRDSLHALGNPVTVPTVFLVNRTSYAAGELAIDAVRSARPDVAVVLEAAGPIPNLGYNGFQSWYPDSLLLPHGRIPIISADGALGSVVDVAISSISIDGMEATALQALAARRRQTPRAPFSFGDARIVDDSVSMAPLTREQRIAGLLKIWYWAGHFYAYLDDASTNWQHLVSDWLPRVEAAKDPVEYYRVLEKIGALLHDNHNFVDHPLAPHSPPAGGIFVPSVFLTWVGERLAVARTDSSVASYGIAPGDEVLRIDGQSVTEFERESRRYRSISRATDRVLPMRMIFGAKDTQVSLQVRTHKGIRTVSLPRNRRAGGRNSLADWNHPLFEVLAGNIGYVNLAKLDDSPRLQDSVLAGITRTSALILDDRAGPPSGLNLSWFLNGVSQWMSAVNAVLYQHGGYTPMRAFGTDQTWRIPLLDPRGGVYQKPIVVLTAAGKQSAGESLAISLRITGRAVFVGEATNGTYGSQQQITLPGGARFTFTGNRALFPSGAKYHGVGVVPDVPVRPTFAGLRAQRDEVFERGVATLKAIMMTRVAKRK